MAVWEKCKVIGTDPGSRIQIDSGGLSSVRILSQSFRQNDGVDFATVGRGNQLVFGGVETLGAQIVLSASQDTDGDTQGTAIGVFSVNGGTGTYTFTLNTNGGGTTQVAGTNGVNLQVGATAPSVGTVSISVHADNGAGSTLDQSFPIGTVPKAPTLALDAGSDSGASNSDHITNINTPQIDITFSSNLATGDVISIKDGATLLVAHTVTSGEAGSTTLDLSLSALADGVHSLTAQLSRGSLDSAFSSALSITVKTSLPSLSSPTATDTDSTSGTGSVSTDTGTGTLYWVTDTESAPTAAQIIAGEASGGGTPSDHGSQSVSATGVQNISTSGLTASTTYSIFYVQVDVAGNVSSVSSSSTFTTASGGGSYSSQATQYFDRLNTDPGASWKTALAAFIDGLVTDGIWTTLDCLQLYAHTTQANALIDLVNSGLTASVNGTPTFTAKQGFSAFSSTSNVSTGFNPTSNGVNYVQNSATMSMWSNTAAQNTNYDVGITGSPGVFIKARDTSNLSAYRINNGSTASPSNSDGSGLFTVYRQDSNHAGLYRNASLVGSDTIASTAVPNAVAKAGFVASAGSGRQIALMAFGATRNSTAETNFYNRVNTLMTTISGL